MPGSSISHWVWSARPDARLEGDFVFTGDRSELYCPGEFQEKLLNAVQQVVNEPSALEFVKKWGLLGLGQTKLDNMDRFIQLNGAVAFTYALRKKEDPNLTEGSIMQEAIDFFYSDVDYNKLQNGEAVGDILSFSQEIQYLSEVKRLLKLYEEYPIAADYETKEWLEGLSPYWYKVLVRADMGIIERQYKIDKSTSNFYRYILDDILDEARFLFSSKPNKGIWVQLRTKHISNNWPMGDPILQFDGLYQFIKYILLVDGGPYPKRCADPKCRQLFFPAKADQEYCPPPPGVKRSRCENRHNQWLKRHGMGKSKHKPGNEEG